MMLIPWRIITVNFFVVVLLFSGSTNAACDASDYFKITVQAGQRLSFEILGRRLGGQLDPQLTLQFSRTEGEGAAPGDTSSDTS